MNAKDYASQLLQALEQAKARGVESFATDDLITYVKGSLAASAGEPTATDIEQFKSVITAGQSALRTSLLINGGASVAMLTFIGSLATSLATNPSKPPLMDPKLLATPLAIFVIGVILGALDSGGTYLVQRLYHQRRGRSADCLNLLVILLGFATYCLFVYGAYKAYWVFV